MFTIELVPNTDCNLGCYFCFANKHSCGLLTDDNFKKLLDLVDKMENTGDYIFLKIYGGEAMLHYKNVMSHLKILDEYLEINKNKEYYVAIISNGTIMPDDYLDYITTIKNYKLGMSFSMEVDEDTHNEIRHYKNSTIGSFDVVKANIQKYSKHIGEVAYIQTVLSPNLLEDPNKYIEFMERHKDGFVFNLVPMFDSTFGTCDLKVLDNMKILFDYYIKKFNENDAKHVGTFQSERSIFNKIMYDLKTGHCTAGVNQITIMPNGDLYPCSKMFYNDQTHIGYGNIADQEIDDIITKFESYKSLMSDLNTFDVSCKSCQLKSDFGCTGGCLSERMNNNNEWYEFVCIYNKVLGRESMRLLEESIHTPQFINRLKNGSLAKNKKVIYDEFLKRLGIK